MPGTDPFAFLTLDDLRRRTSVKWRRYDADVLPLWVAEMDVPLAAPLRDALARAVADGDTGYPAGTDYVDSFVAFAGRHWEWPTLAPSQVRPVASVIDGYTDALVVAAGTRGHVVVTPPVYPPFFSYLGQAGLTLHEAPLAAGLRLDLDAIDAALGRARAATDDGVGLLLCNPHNPGGTLHTRAELEALAALASKHGATVVSDEIHAPLVYAPGQFVPYLAVDPRGIALHAASKAFNLAAMPAALAVFGDEAADLRRTFEAGAHGHPSHFGALAQAVAYAEGDAWLADLMTALDRRRTLLGDLLTKQVPGARYTAPAATYLAWVDCRELGLGDDPSAAFLERGRVAFNPGHTFGTGGAGHVRINIATSEQVLTEAVARMAATLERA